MEIFSSVSTFDNQSFLLVLFSVVLSLLLSTLIVFTYEKVSRDVSTPDHFLQSLILMALVTTTIMQSIGDSPARGFGIFGALAILRFRTQLFSPRNISFIFAAMSVGIACGVYSFIIAIIGTLAFCGAAFFLWLTPFSRKNNLLGRLRYELPGNEEMRLRVMSVIEKETRRNVLKRYRVINEKSEAGGHNIEYNYELQLRNELDGLALVQKLQDIDGVRNVRLDFNDTYINLYE
jgi:uncharacterized membrane protein YhiD involved in acid resistance